MAANLDLVITADAASLTAELRLLDGDGIQLAYRSTDFKTIAESRRQALFDLRNYLKNYVEPGKEEASVAEIGVCIAEHVLGQEIFLKLWQAKNQRTLRIQLPGATEEENQLAAALARVPWEIARPAADKPSLADQHLLVCVVHEMAAPATRPLNLVPDEPLRVLFVFAEARGSRPLAARRERRELLRLFEREIYPNRRVVAHFLTHGVTRERLKAQIEENGGYHIVHWSGHGHLNLLELAKAGGGSDRLSGQELLDLCGGFIPPLFFLSACHSGDILRVRDWKDFLAVAKGQESGTKQAPDPATKHITLNEEPGYTGTAHALLQGGVPTVVAMRYAVGDEYARELGIEFYRALLAHEQPKNVAAALTMARQVLGDPTNPSFARFAACDHATPVLYGTDEPGLTLPKGRGPALEPRNPRLHAIAELTIKGHEHFVGRTWELDGLGADFIGSSGGSEARPAAVITGLGGMGKTALTAEALALWESRFAWVLLYQAKPNALGFDATLRNIHMKLNGELGRYYTHVKAHPADAVHRAADGDFTGPDRLDRLTSNLIRALSDEAVLLVLDNFETNLKPQAEPGTNGEPLWACQDPAWDRCLARLATELVGTPSRVLITCRRPLAALAGTASHRVMLGPLSPDEAALYLREHAGLSKMVFGADKSEMALALRLLNASRFHPLLMDRLARLATGGRALRPQLMVALDDLEQSHDHTQLPALFATDPGDAKELAYLEDALATSLDQLIRDSNPDARRMLWMIAVANEPVTFGLLKSVWQGGSLQEQQPATARPDPEPLLRNLVAVGLGSEELSGPDDDNPHLTCHELVRERIRKWMSDHEQDRSNLSENSIRLAYAERLVAVFVARLHKDMTAALQAGSLALVYCVQADAWDLLTGFADSLVTSTLDPRKLEDLIPTLQDAAEFAPEGVPRFLCLSALADAIRIAGHPDESLRVYEQAANKARTAAEAGGEDMRGVWTALARISHNWGLALTATSNLGPAPAVSRKYRGP